MVFTSNTPSNFGLFFSKPLSHSKTNLKSENILLLGALREIPIRQRLVKGVRKLKTQPHPQVFSLL